MPVNFYKIWKPLHDLLSVNKLLTNCKILELGTGPGTATLGLLSFYFLLAIDNPNLNLNVEITAIEREKNFKKIFDFLIAKLISCFPPNFHAEVKFINGDAFESLNEYDNNYDILLESNLLNINEDISSEKIDNFIQIMKKVLHHKSLVIMIEPGKNENMYQLQEIMQKALKHKIASSLIPPMKIANDISRISICQDATNAGLRYGKKTAHWFSYTILQQSEHINDSQCQ